MSSRSEQMQRAQEKFEAAGLFFDEVEWDDMERLKYQSMPPDEWAEDYIKRAGNRQTVESLRAEVVRRKRASDKLREELFREKLSFFIGVVAAVSAVFYFYSPEINSLETLLFSAIGLIFLIVSAFILSYLVKKAWRLLDNYATPYSSFFLFLVVIPAFVLLIKFLVKGES